MMPSHRTAVPDNFPDSTDHLPLLLANGEPTEPGAAAHLARLCLDLQVDALLLTLGAGAVTEPGREALPWRRWLTEDVTLAVELARTALAGGDCLPGSLGGTAQGQVDRLVDDLSAHYLAMHTMLADLAGSRFGAGRPGDRLGQALEHCHRRLQELDAVQGARPEPRPERRAEHRPGSRTAQRLASPHPAPAAPSTPAPCPEAEPAARTIDLCPAAGARTQYLAGHHLG
jgi:hypothetical protein